MEAEMHKKIDQHKQISARHSTEIHRKPSGVSLRGYLLEYEPNNQVWYGYPRANTLL